jgi:hypothetical protein
VGQYPFVIGLKPDTLVVGIFGVSPAHPDSILESDAHGKEGNLVIERRFWENFVCFLTPAPF